MYNGPSAVNFDESFQEQNVLLNHAWKLLTSLLMCDTQTWSKAVLFLSMLVWVNIGVYNTVFYTVCQKN